MQHGLSLIPRSLYVCVYRNLQATGYLGGALDILALARCLRNSIFVPPSSIRVTIRTPALCYVSLHASGKFILLGCRTSLEAIRAGRKVARMVQKSALFFHKDVIRFRDFKIHNVAGHGALGYRVDLSALSKSSIHEDYCEVSI